MSEWAMSVEVDQRVHIEAPPERVWRALVEQDDLRRSRTGRRPAASSTPR
jgi:uncharacterized protein YndB with AHSA1/START domain